MKLFFGILIGLTLLFYGIRLLAGKSSSTKPTGEKGRIGQLWEKHQDAMRQIGFIIACLVLLNLLCWTRKDWGFWWALWGDKTLFFLVMGMMVFAIYVLKVTKKGAARLFAYAILVAIALAWHNETGKHPSSPASQSAALVLPPLPPAASKVVKEQVPVPAETWSEWEPILGKMQLIWPGDAKIEFQVKDADGNVSLRPSDPGKLKDWKDNSIYQRYRADRNTVYNIERI